MDYLKARKTEYSISDRTVQSYKRLLKTPFCPDWEDMSLRN